MSTLKSRVFFLAVNTYLYVYRKGCNTTYRNIFRIESYNVRTTAIGHLLVYPKPVIIGVHKFPKKYFSEAHALDALYWKKLSFQPPIESLTDNLNSI